MDIMDIKYIMEVMDIMDIMDIMGTMDIMNIMDIMIITAWLAMAGAFLPLFFFLYPHMVFFGNTWPLLAIFLHIFFFL